MIVIINIYIMTKKEAINMVLDANIKYPMVILSEADWKGGRQCYSYFGDEAENMLIYGMGDFDYIEFIAKCNNDLYRAIMNGKTFTDVYDTENGMEFEDRSITDFIP